MTTCLATPDTYSGDFPPRCALDVGHEGGHRGGSGSVGGVYVLGDEAWGDVA